jgi:malonate-semialdehyde dehydrogenase (acetylating)/methylmalonate-semialdehyde dehydrogenase
MATKTIGHWIDGKVYERPPGGGGGPGEDVRHGDVFNPATGEVQAKVAFATAAEVDLAVESAAARSPPTRSARSTAASR